MLNYCSFKSKQDRMKKLWLFHGNKIEEGISQNRNTILKF